MNDRYEIIYYIRNKAYLLRFYYRLIEDFDKYFKKGCEKLINNNSNNKNEINDFINDLIIIKDSNYNLFY